MGSERGKIKKNYSINKIERSKRKGWMFPAYGMKGNGKGGGKSKENGQYK